MKIGNLLNGQNYQAQSSLHRQFWRSIMLAALLIISIVTVSALQYVEYGAIHQEYIALKSGNAELYACLERKRALKEEIAGLQERLIKMNRIKDRPKNPSNILEILQRFSGDVSLQEITLNKKKLDLIVFAQDIKILLAYAEQLRSNSLFGSVEAISYEQSDDRVKAHMSIVLK